MLSKYCALKKEFTGVRSRLHTLNVVYVDSGNDIGNGINRADQVAILNLLLQIDLHIAVHSLGGWFGFFFVLPACFHTLFSSCFICVCPSSILL